MLKSSLVMLFLITPQLFSQETDIADVAIVKMVRGDVEFTLPGSNKKELLAPYQWHAAGTRIVTGSESQAILVFLEGARYHLFPNSVVILQAKGPSVERGSVKRTDDSMQTLVSPIAGGDQTPDYSGVVRIRSQGLVYLYPTGKARVTADNPVLNVKTRPSGLSYDLQIEDENGQLLFETRTRVVRPQVPGNILAPNKRYYFRVRPIHPVISHSWTEASFSTLSEMEVQRRNSLEEALQLGSRSDLAFSAAVDRQLGLFWEANKKMGFLAVPPSKQAYNKEPRSMVRTGIATRHMNFWEETFEAGDEH